MLVPTEKFLMQGLQKLVRCSLTVVLKWFLVHKVTKRFMKVSEKDLPTSHPHCQFPNCQPVTFFGFCSQETLNRPFAGSGQMVRNKLHWDANDTVGLPKQKNSYQSSPTFLCFESPTVSFASQCNLFCTMWPDPAKGVLTENLKIVLKIFCCHYNH